MKPGQILVADHNGVYIIKMLGDVRLTLCISFDQFIDAMFKSENFTSVLFDLSDAEAIDSTTLGLMAKISILGQERCGIVPVILASNPSIQRILQTMGFGDIFTIVDKLDAPMLSAQPLNCVNCDEQEVKEKVLEAHKILMGLNASNADTFRNLVNMLENC
ncbi:anti-anti-sigma factor [Cellvibrio sp. BR]|jgi:anti-anti-sigma factor|uniref:STAS domain-containing protein n=1 Tax=Cellvibrio sp. BR TaxID=1134474 RepID=UPI0002601862|nr:STAS domain-containing protein [Cellvibrio sp. BR]EIK45471.1 anti-anti-sigma factor [Cellvibrio sp. BR]